MHCHHIKSHLDAYVHKECNESLRVQVKELKERLVSLKQTTGSQTDARRIRQLEKERRELRGRVASLLRLADSLLEEGR